jgi:hypothetical protein
VVSHPSTGTAGGETVRREYDFSRAVNLYGAGASRRRVRRKLLSGGALRGDRVSLTKRQIRELKSRLADLKEPVRYLLVTDLGPRFALYYNVSDDVYAMNDPTRATLFKRRSAAIAVRKLLGRGVRVARCRTKRSGARRVVVRLITPGKSGGTSGRGGAARRPHAAGGGRRVRAQRKISALARRG